MTTYPLVMTQSLALQLEQSKADHIASWLRGMQEQSAHLFGVEIVQRGNLRAFAASKMQEIGLFNQVIGLGPENMHDLPEILYLYRELGVVTYRLEINPFHITTDVLAYLASLGLSHSGFQTYVYGPALCDPVSRPETVSLQEVTPAEIEVFADMHLQGFQEALAHASEETLRLYRESLRVLQQLSGWHLYLALVNHMPAGMGMLYIEEGKATLAGGATLPQFRRRGCHQSLLTHRMEVAAQQHCQLVVAQTTVGSASQQHMERFGMRTAYTAAFWTPASQ